MVFLFRDKSIVNIFFLAVLSIAVHLHFFAEAPLIIVNKDDGFFSDLLIRYVKGQPDTLLFLLYHCLILVQAIRLNMVLNDLRMFQQTTYTAAMAYILLSGMLVQWCSISSSLISNFMVIWIFIRLSKLYNHPSPKTLLFNTGLIVGASVLCYHPTAILIGVVLFALAVVRPFRLAEWLILLMGILLPFYFLFSWLFLTDQLGRAGVFLPSIEVDLPLKHWDISLITGLSVLLLNLLIGFYYWQLSINRMVIQIRKTWSVMLVMLLILLAIPFIFRQTGVESGVMCLVPLASYASIAFSAPRRLIVPNLLFWLAAAVIVYNNWLLFKN